MKGYALLILVFLLLWKPFSSAADYNNIAISGTVHNPSFKEIKVVLYNFVPGEDHLSSSASLDDNNSFHFVSYIREPVFGRVYYGRESFPIYMEPGYDLRIAFRSDNVKESIDFSGVGAANCSFLARRAFQFELPLGLIKEKAKNYSVKSYHEWANSRKDAELAFLNKEKEELTNQFVHLQQADIEYSWANLFFSYIRFKQEENENLASGEISMDFLDEVKLHQYEVIQLQSYRDFLENYLLYNYAMVKESLPKENSQYYSNMYQVARKNLRSLPMYHMQALYLVKALNYLGVDFVKDEYIEFANECPNQSYKNILHQMVKAQTVIPKKPEIIFTDRKGKSVPLKELSGSIVLVRFTNNNSDSTNLLVKKHDKLLKDRLSSYKDVKFLDLPMVYNEEAFTKMIYADATEYLKSIMNRPKPGQEKPKVPPFSYVLLNREGLVVSNSLDDPRNELAVEKIDALIQQEKRSAIVE